MMKKWEVLSQFRIQNSEFRINNLIEILLKNRNIKTKKETEEFLNPDLDLVTPKSVGIDELQLEKALKRIEKAVKKKEQIVVFGDYDVDGITGSAILWEKLYEMGAKVLPYIPHRVDEGYGLSSKGISNLQSQISNVSLIITTDNGIVAQDAVDFANSKGIDVIITDHHVADKKLPDAYAIVHTTNLCGAGVAYLLSKELKSKSQPRRDPRTKDDNHLELAALGTIADLVPLTGANRAIVKNGLEKLCKTKRPGLMELFKQAGIDREIFTTYEVGYLICPRLNATGRIGSAMDSLRLLCTNDRNRAESLAEKLELINKERQMMMRDQVLQAIEETRDKKQEAKSLLFAASKNYNQGVIGLIAGKLVEKFYRPAIVLSVGEIYTKASARSVSGFNLIEFLRSFEKHFINVGGHPMAAGFTIETKKLDSFQKALEQKAEEIIDEDILKRKLKIDCELEFPYIDTSLHKAIQNLSPFGMGNPEPVFMTKGVEIKNVKTVGALGKHLKLELGIRDKELWIDAIAFGLGEDFADLKIGDIIDIVYTIDENTWNGNTKLQLKVRDIKDE